MGLHTVRLRSRGVEVRDTKMWWSIWRMSRHCLAHKGAQRRESQRNPGGHGEDRTGLCSEGAARRGGVDPARESQLFGATARNSTLGRCLRVAANDSGHLRFPHYRPFSRRRGYGRSRRKPRRRGRKTDRLSSHLQAGSHPTAPELAGVDFPLGMVLASVTS